MIEIDKLREKVYKQVTDALSKDNIKVCKRWDEPIHPLMSIALKLYDVKKKRILTIEQGKEDDFFEFSFAIRKTGIDFDELDLLLIFEDVESNIEKIIEIYKLWFIDEVSQAEISNILEEYIYHEKNKMYT